MAEVQSKFSNTNIMNENQFTKQISEGTVNKLKGKTESHGWVTDELLKRRSEKFQKQKTTYVAVEMRVVCKDKKTGKVIVNGVGVNKIYPYFLFFLSHIYISLVCYFLLLFCALHNFLT